MEGGAINSDGTRIAVTADDATREAEVDRILADRWQCAIRRFPKLHPIDRYAERHTRLVALVELKCFRKSSTDHPTVIVAVKKWMSLKLGAFGLNVPGFFVFSMIDGVFFVDVDRINATRQRITGRRDRAGMPHDVEPMIDVPVEDLGRISP